MIEGGKYQKKIKGLFFSEGRRIAKLGILTAIFDMICLDFCAFLTLWGLRPAPGVEPLTAESKPKPRTVSLG